MLKSILTFFITLIFIDQVCGQTDIDKIRDSIIKEADKLYKSEYASWYGTDIFFQEYKGDQDIIGGYVSYPIGDDDVCIFYSNSNDPEIIGTIHFKSNKKVVYDSVRRTMTATEKDFYNLKTAAQNVIQSDTGLFLYYKGSTLNLVPIIEKDRKWVYAISGSSKPNTAYLGNDYLMTFTNKNELISKKRIHQSLIPVPYTDPDKKDEFGSVHNHLPETGDFITATDICTIRLYQEYGKWKSHIVVSEKYMSIWTCEGNGLVIVPSPK
ncbi:hypothetical protein ACQ33O_08575 [Ferruginibacter sp. SUN002]|uniref:hypothetical protein n=1 Tax=Ferruginibacter sp. SUN002 TaxID=2937789 RepID=UPI003D3645F4